MKSLGAKQARTGQDF